MKYILGIDQGGTKTVSIVSDEKGNILGYGIDIGACHASEGMDFAMEKIYNASLKALKQAQLEITDIYHVVAGLTGADWAYEYPLLEDALKKTLNINRVTVYNDSIIAMRGGTSEKNTAVICAGTGLNIALKNNDKEYIFGYYVDENVQGGGALGKNAIKAVFNQESGIGLETMLTNMILKYYKLSNVDNLTTKYYNNALEKEVKYLAPILFKAAEIGDKVAINIIIQLGENIAVYVISRAKKMMMQHTRLTIVLSGSIFKNKFTLLKDTLDKSINKELKAKLIDAKFEPVVGAVLLVLDMLCDDNIDNSVMENITNTCKEYDLIRTI